jgi:deoxyadenosine/deoxycytidine kinase
VKRYVVLAGNIGAGKSTLVRMLCDRLGWKPYFEPVAENPYLADFYDDMDRWAFASQVFFMAWRVKSHRALMDDPGTVVQDRSLYEDAEVFACNLHRQGHMSDRDWQTYRELYRTFTTLLPAPDLVVYLRASVPTLLERIGRRGRGFEAGIGREYLEGLNTPYEEWISTFRLAPVLVVPSDRLDFVTDTAALGDIVATVGSACATVRGCCSRTGCSRAGAPGIWSASDRVDRSGYFDGRQSELSLLKRMSSAMIERSAFIRRRSTGTAQATRASSSWGTDLRMP